MVDSSVGVTPLNPAQRDEWEAGRLPDAEDLGGGLWSIPLAIPEGNLPGTLCYALLGDDGVHVIDPGWGSQENEKRLDEVLQSAGRGIDDIVNIIVTHHHPDHLGLAPRLRERTGARIVMSAIERSVLAHVMADDARDSAAYQSALVGWGVPKDRHAELSAGFAKPFFTGDIEPDVLVADGDVIEVAGRRLEVVGTPGHTGGHICLADRSAGLLFTGDHILPRVYAGVGLGTLPGAEPLTDLLGSLARLAEFDEFAVLPGHEFRFRGLGARRVRIAEHHLRRTRQVAALIPELGTSPVWEYASRLTWTGGWDGLQAFWLHSALRQTHMHLELVQSGLADQWLLDTTDASG